MAIKETTNHIRKLLGHITHDLEKADSGNKAAAQRVRTGTVKLEKLAKLYRKESIQFDKKNKGTKKPSAKKSTSSMKAKKSTAAPKAKISKLKAKSKTHRPSARAFSVKKKSSSKKMSRKKGANKSWLGKLF